MDRTDLPPPPQATPARTFDARRVRDHHEPNPGPRGLTETVTYPCSRPLGSKVSGWVGGHFEFVELAVTPEARGRGIGGQLHDALLANLDHRRALLATSSSQDDPAVRLYSSRGWVSLATYGDNRQVMGRVLSE
ncbi:GNAT family N-acetyltransferase [Microbacterium aurugineum]|uniref:GNAT family N-acetyltransferase n=1 Tax=Microbacterium aurugineum TaxID=2851642 RepID=UPI0035592A89